MSSKAKQQSLKKFIREKYGEKHGKTSLFVLQGKSVQQEALHATTRSPTRMRAEKEVEKGGGAERGGRIRERIAVQFESINNGFGHNMSDSTLSESDLPIDDRLSPRLRGILDFVGQGWRYALGQVPEESTWGFEPHTLATLVYRGIGIKILVVGTLTSIKVDVSESKLRSSIVLEVELMREKDVDARDMLLARSNPRNDFPADDVLVATADCTGERMVFDSFYDAEDGYVAREHMPHANVHDFAVGDIVLLDVMMRRRSEGAYWSKYTPYFELRHASLLIRSPVRERTRRACSPDGFKWGL
ncbi:hypothetical protein FKP32DRAFT_1607462 [Trametes sanguinea]|nr:hypothetical protein FKP32DRAFT_1607462 [Trametes sanguinea]